MSAISIRFKESFHVEILEPDEVFLFSENGVNLLKGKVYSAIAKKIKDRALTEEDLLDELEESFSHAEIYYALERLFHGNFLTKDEALAKGWASFFEVIDVPASLGMQRLKNATVAICNFSSLNVDALEEELKALSLNLSDDADLTLVVVEDYLDERVIQWAHYAKGAWLLIKPIGKEIWIGPIFKVGKSPCYECLVKRMQGNRLEQIYVQNKTKTTAPFITAKAFISSTTNLAYNLAATFAFKWMATEGSCSKSSELISFDCNAFEIKKHELIPFANCQCSFPTMPALTPLILQNHKKLASVGGGYRTARAEDTLKKCQHLISPITGIVGDLTSSKKNDKIHVYSAGHNFAFSNLNKLQLESFRSKSSGKGKCDIQAKVGALCEAIERYSFVSQGNEYKIAASYDQIEQDAIHPSHFNLFSQAQFASRDQPISTRTAHVPERFCEKTVIDWTPLWSLKDKVYKYIPSAYCYYAYAKENGGSFFNGDSNGCASGNTLEEAILQGFFELVERDSVALWWYNRVQRPSVDLNGFNDPFFAAMMAEYEAMGRKLWVLDLTSDLNIPVFAAISHVTNSKKNEIILGFGAHLNAEIALERALAELNQSLLFFESVQPDVEGDLYIDWYRREKLQDHLYLIGKGVKTRKDYDWVEREGILDDLLFSQKIVENLGMEMLIQDATRADTGLHAARVVIPGLRHFWPRFAPGRLYDVPVKLGWLDKPLSEEQLNPIPMFL